MPYNLLFFLGLVVCTHPVFAISYQSAVYAYSANGTQIASNFSDFVANAVSYKIGSGSSEILFWQPFSASGGGGDYAVQFLGAADEFIMDTQVDGEDKYSLTILNADWGGVVGTPICGKNADGSSQPCPDVLAIGTTQLAARYEAGDLQPFDKYFAEWAAQRGQVLTDDFVKVRARAWSPRQSSNAVCYRFSSISTTSSLAALGMPCLSPPTFVSSSTTGNSGLFVRVLSNLRHLELFLISSVSSTSRHWVTGRSRSGSVALAGSCAPLSASSSVSAPPSLDWPSLLSQLLVDVARVGPVCTHHLPAHGQAGP